MTTKSKLLSINLKKCPYKAYSVFKDKYGIDLKDYVFNGTAGIEINTEASPKDNQVVLRKEYSFKIGKNIIPVNLDFKTEAFILHVIITSDMKYLDEFLFNLNKYLTVDNDCIALISDEYVERE